MQRIVENIKRRAAERNLTIRRLEIQAQLSNGAVARWDEKPPSIDKVYRVAKVLGCAIDDLIDDQPDTTEDVRYFRSVSG